MSWTNERTDLLKTLWADGLSASAIANKLGAVTRNAVIGKVHRLGLQGRRATRSFQPRFARRRAAPLRSRSAIARRAERPLPRRTSAKPRAPGRPILLPDLGPAPVFAITVATLTDRTCRYPDGDPKRGDFHFCGRDKGSASGPYCSHHAAIAYPACR
jgi:GcrA cell cycle regulator